MSAASLSFTFDTISSVDILSLRFFIFNPTFAALIIAFFTFVSSIPNFLSNAFDRNISITAFADVVLDNNLSCGADTNDINTLPLFSFADSFNSLANELAPFFVDAQKYPSL